MKLTLFTLALCALAFAGPAPAPEIEKRSEKCKIVGDGARCRRSASLDADIIGEFFVGDTPTFTCTTLNSDGFWDRTTKTIHGSVVECFVSDTLVAAPCPGGLPDC
ncbi:hypothetical protein C8R45DRAFT_260526 [Mycena sanguinolenta]|nr:hypothetical protein C8R45DRAFT_260526 [Mycena sanguinolenta]